jgi:hypothetical protein
VIEAQAKNVIEKIVEEIGMIENVHQIVGEKINLKRNINIGIFHQLDMKR